VWTAVLDDTAINLSPPRFEAGGWMHWPDNEDYSLQFMRVLGSAQEGSSTISECFLTASRIVPGDDESWYREWKAIADANKARGDLARAADNLSSACSNWLRASNYYRTSEIFLKLDDRRRGAVLEKMRACSDLVVTHQPLNGERVRIPCFEGGFVEAFFLRAPGVDQSGPVVVCVGGQGHFKDAHLHTLPRQAYARGLSLLLVDLPGQGASPRSKASVRYEVETAISCCLDYLIARGDVDERRIAIFGEGLGAAFASRAANLDDRFAVSVSDAGIWDTHERVSMMTWMSGTDGKEAIAAEIRRMGRHGGLAQVRCPTLVTFGERDWLDIAHATEMCRVLRDAGADITLKVFTAGEAAASHAQTDNPTIGNEFIFDWIVTRLDAIQSARTP
jgi:pimeloyl-ACP methyl ester carboxylesterase